MLESLLVQEEGKTLEFKENATSLSKIIQTIIAFANTAGGTLIIGVKDKTKEVVGVKDILKEEERLASAIADSITPLITPIFQFSTWRDRDVLIISVGFNPKPYFLKSKKMEQGVYVRLGSTNRLADHATIAEIQRLTVRQSYDELPNFQSKPEDIDFPLAKELFSHVEKKFDTTVAKSIDLLVQYQSKWYPTNGAILLFGQNRKKIFSDAVIRCGYFSGTTKTHILDSQEINSALPIAIKEILFFIERHTSKKSEIDRLQRRDISQYPPIVVREAVINAIVHTDYSIKGANTEIAIYSDRLEITSPGGLPYGLSLEKALSGISQLRNRVIGHTFRELQLIERWGSGLGRMIDICNEQGITRPKFEELDHFFRVTLYHDTKFQLEKEPWKLEVVKYIETHKQITTKDMSNLLKITERTASTKLKKMRDEGIIVEISTSPYDPKKKFVLAK